MPAELPFSLLRSRTDEHRAKQGQGRDHQHVQIKAAYHFKRFSWFTSTLSTLRFIITRMARPTVTSAAATSMMKNTNTCPRGIAVVGAEGRQQQVHAVEHQLQAHQDDDGVAPEHHARPHRC
jgi:hypothetical protein